MTQLRIGSAEYHELLDRLEAIVEHDPDYPSWGVVDTAWQNLVATPRSELRLFDLAHLAMARAAFYRGIPTISMIALAHQLHDAKNAGYAGRDQPDPWANFRMSVAFGITPFDGVLVRMSDKYIRTINLRRDPENERVGEGMQDTLLDLSAYALIAICLLREARTRP